MRTLRTCVFCGRDTITENPHQGTICFDCKSNAQLLSDLEIGRKWREDSSLEAWFPFTAEQHFQALSQAAEMLREMANTRPLCAFGHSCSLPVDLRNEAGRIADACQQLLPMQPHE